jgi:hypothetical protein
MKLLNYYLTKEILKLDNLIFDQGNIKIRQFNI